MVPVRDQQYDAVFAPASNGVDVGELDDLLLKDAGNALYNELRCVQRHKLLLRFLVVPLYRR